MFNLQTKTNYCFIKNQFKHQLKYLKYIVNMLLG